jgi:hypothetical protein
MGLRNKMLLSLLKIFIASTLVSSCYIYNFFKDDPEKKETTTSAVLSGAVLGQPLGQRAYGLNEAALADVHAVTTTIEPSPIRPDPDTYIRQMLRSYRSEGMTLARQIGSVEDYRDLLGGANVDFSKDAAGDYDATSLLSSMKVAEVICEGLVAPNSTDHEGWTSILPADASDWQTNIEFLAQRFIGLPSDQIESSVITELKVILDGFDTDGVYEDASYIPVCTVLAIDAEALLL